MAENKADNLDPHAYKLIVTPPSSLSPSQLSVVFDDLYDRIPHPNADIENSISKIWDQRVQGNSLLYNGKKFRYGGCILNQGLDEYHVTLHLGLTDYRTFVGTNLNPLWESFLVSSEDDCRQSQHTSSPLGNGAIVETSDKKILVLQRSCNVGEFPGYFVFPGGHPEPEEIGITSHQSKNDSNALEITNRRVGQEIFDSIIREVVEEIGVPEKSLSNPVFIGISNRILNVRHAAFFFIKCNLEAEEIQQLYSSAQDGYESTHLYAVSMIELEEMSRKMPGCHRGGYALYKLMVERCGG
ncbi:nudix hydrolase 9 [Impatiens glandulifera]|uniref:nudix hydrolase 9 n=1 Tax=Impatiens glandulifera TaxID=253017 RepID=UPI001FB0C52C|nr:nudix hydrolase 9 [Impatiens glandulifera]